MMRMRLGALQMLLILLVFRKGCRGIKCYQCSSVKDVGCSINKADPKYVKPCPSSYSYCRKAVDMYYFVGAKEYRTIRECAKWRNDEKSCYRGRYTRDSYQLTCECKGDNCNGSTEFSPSIVFRIFYPFILIFVRSPT